MMVRVNRALAHPAYRRLFVAQVVALAGTGVATVALGLLAFDLAGDRAGAVLGTVLAVKMVAYVAVAPVAAALTARLPRRGVLVGADLLRLVVALSLPFVDQTWQVYLLVFVLQSASATFTPTFQAVIPEILPDEADYTSALSLSRMAYDLEAVLSPMLAAALLLVVPASGLFFVTAAGFTGSALLVAPMLLPRPAPVEQAPLRERVGHGVRVVVRTPALRPVLALNLSVAAAGAYVLVQTVVVVRSALGLGAAVVAVVLAANGAGSILGAVLLPRLLRRWSERRAMLTGAVAAGVGVAVVPAALVLARGASGGASIGAALAGVVVLWVLVGWGWACAETPVGRLVRRNVPAADLPAVFAAQFSLSHACWLVTYPLVGWLGAAAGLSRTAVVMAVVSLGATAVTAALWPRGSGVAGADGAVLPGGAVLPDSAVRPA